ncbi:MAG: 2-amino-4-hydroxy-6-hydroxymethyldihydropteridine diphosphokinase [Corynebacterium sp.]|nr:2-amino-4-hydroxy-6-hydroxymethyldihydropteridine diphosphokinase [Corynebacterium sp.]
MRAVLSIGSNVGDRLEHLDAAFAYFEPQISAVSGIYATKPWGNTEQQEFYNAILLIDTHLSPLSLLRHAQSIENEQHRRRDIHWGPRTLDVDVICYQGVTSVDPVLRLPHPYARERAFVLIPWLEADPNATLAGQNVIDLIGLLPEEEREGIRRLETPLGTTLPGYMEQEPSGPNFVE